jgi:hypothetical protein
VQWPPLRKKRETGPRNQECSAKILPFSICSFPCANPNAGQPLERSGDSEHDWITEKPCHDEFDAFDELVAAAATTLPGLVAKLAYLQELAEREAWMFNGREGTAIRLIEGFAASIAALVQVQS